MSNLKEYLTREFNKQHILKFASRADSTKIDIGMDSVGDMGLYVHQQDYLRPVFGKSGFVEPRIGDHPDYEKLKGTKTSEPGYSVSMFMDIEASTRLGLLLDNVIVKDIKDRIIRTAMSVVAALDGHVHRIMGDAILVFFNQHKFSPGDACINALNAASILMFLSKNVVLPTLQSEYNVPDFGIRIGLDYGPDTIWSSYGFHKMEEVTATSFYVDVASKLQSSAPRHGILIGNNLKNLLDLPLDTLIDTIKDSPYVEPNYRTSDGALLNYPQWKLDWEHYLTYIDIDAGLNDTSNIDVQVKAGTEQYKPCSNRIKKGTPIEMHFKVPFHLMARNRLQVNMTRINTGNEAHERAPAPEDIKLEETADITGKDTYTFKSYAAWMGFHYVKVEIRSHGTLLASKKVGVYIE